MRSGFFGGCVLIVAVCGCVLCGVAARSAAQSGRPPAAVEVDQQPEIPPLANGVIVGHAVRADVSPPLRDLVAGAGRPAAEPKPAQAGPPPLPEKVAPLADLGRQTARYDQLAYDWKWGTVFHRDFSGFSVKPGAEGGDKQEPAWELGTRDGKPTGATAALAREGEQTVLVFDARGHEGCTLAVSPMVKGDFAFEVRERIRSDRLVDMSLFVDSAEHGPGFQFGAFNNAHNILWGGPQRGEDGQTHSLRQDLPDSAQRIEKDKWHRVRLELRDGLVSAFVDGKLAGRTALGNQFDRSAAHQPLVYAYDTAVDVAEVMLEAYAPDGPVPEAKAGARGAWERAFGSKTREQVRAGLAKLVECLGDDDAAVRESAEAVLMEAGRLAIPALESAAREGGPEQAARARRVLKGVAAPGEPGPRRRP